MITKKRSKSYCCNVTTMPLDQFILFGDSITQGAYDQSKGFGLAAELQHAYIRRLDVVNRGFSGYGSNHAIEVLPRFFPTPAQATVKFLTIWFGANDANKNTDGGQPVPLPDFLSNLRSLITSPLVLAHPDIRIILITTPPFEENILIEFRDAWGYKGPVRQAKDAAEYAAATVALGKELGVEVIDAWSLFMAFTGWKEGDAVLPGSEGAGRSEVLGGLLSDGLHLSPAGYKVVYDALIKLIKEKWPELPPYKMPFVMKVPWEIELGDKFWDVNNDA